MNPLTDLIPVKYRKYVYALAALAAWLWAAWEGSQQDWKTFATAVVSALVSSLAHANTKVPSKNDGVVVVGPTDPTSLSFDPTPVPVNPDPLPAPSEPIEPEQSALPPSMDPNVDANGQSLT